MGYARLAILYVGRGSLNHNFCFNLFDNLKPCLFPPLAFNISNRFFVPLYFKDLQNVKSSFVHCCASSIRYANDLGIQTIFCNKLLSPLMQEATETLPNYSEADYHYAHRCKSASSFDMNICVLTSE